MQHAPVVQLPAGWGRDGAHSDLMAMCLLLKGSAPVSSQRRESGRGRASALALAQPEQLQEPEAQAQFVAALPHDLHQQSEYVVSHGCGNRAGDARAGLGASAGHWWRFGGT
jgi:hypothetical protein